MALRAVFLGDPGVVSAGIARGWQLAGHNIAAIWYPERLTATRAFAQDRALGQTAPGLSLQGLALRGGVTLRPVPVLSTWAEAATELAVLAPDVVISALFLDRIPAALLAAFPGRVVNLHPSLLPAYRGRWPTFNMLWDREINRFGGMSLHLVTPDFDAGALLGQQAVAFPESCNLSAYYVQLVQAGAGLLAAHLPPYIAGKLIPVAQPKTDEPQGNRNPRDAVLTSGLEWRQMQWLCATIPQIGALRVLGVGGGVSVRSFITMVGPPTGQPPQQSQGRALEMDALDARVRLAVR